MDSRAKELMERADNLFGKRSTIELLWQETAENFYVERADFTVKRTLGDTFAENLTNSYPLLVRRDLGNSLSGMLRPTNIEWFAMSVAKPNMPHDAKVFLQWATGVQKRAMYDRRSGFVRATKEGDHDYAAFGQCVIQVELNPDGVTLLYRCWHLRDVVWCEGVDGMVDTAYRKWKPMGRTLLGLFPNSIPQHIKTEIDRNPYVERECLHCVVPTSEYTGDKDWRRYPYVSIYIDRDGGTILEEQGVNVFSYVIPRWQTVSGSQYAYSPATVCALPDARLLQAMTLSLLEAGEKAVNPPMVADKQVFRDDFAIYAGGTTWADLNGDRNINEAFAVLPTDKSGIPFGLTLSERTQATLKEAFFLNKLSLPIMAGQMTATEVSQRVQDYIRQAMPLFEPIESDYNGALCERTFEVLLQAGAFGPREQMPKSLSKQEVQFRFQSPLTEATDRKRGQVFLEGAQLIAQAVSLDQTAGMIVDTKTALRDALEGIGMPANWQRSPEVVDEMVAAAEQQAQQAQMLQALQGGADVVKTLAEAGAGGAGAGMPA